MNKTKKIRRYNYPAGMERQILRKMPKLMVAATVIPLMMSVIVRVLPLNDAAAHVGKQLTSIDIFSIAIAVTAWTALFTVAIGCFVVVIMKGPRLLADSYHLKESNRPKTNAEFNRE